MYNHVADWLAALLPSYSMSRGPWVDHSSLRDKFICSLHGAGGAGVDVDDRRPNYRIVLLGPREGIQHASQVQQDAEAIIQAAMSGQPPCGAAGIRALSEVIGPGHTTENRAWCQLDLQVVY